MRIFISYAHVDEPHVRTLVDILRASNHDPWFDQRLVGGQAWEEQLLDAIHACDCFLYALTPESVNSSWCQWEFAQAVHAGKPVLPVCVQSGTPVDGVLSRIQYVDFTHGADTIAVARLFGALYAAEPIDPALVPLMPAPHEVPERPVDQRAIADRLYDEAFAAYRARDYDDALELLHDCLLIDADHADAQQLIVVVERRVGRGQSTPRVEVSEPKPQREPEPPRVLRVTDILPPPFEWIEIPAGVVVLEDASGYLPPGTKGGRYDVPAFVIAKYPITNAQFQVFVDAKDGYRETQWWAYSDHAREWRTDNPQPYNTGFVGDDLPRTNVSWYEAIAFCRWLGAKTGEAITLPTEQQWQRAAQGDDGRNYPWGDGFDPKKCNTSESGIRQPTPVTQYPHGASPYGVLDMAGNVWEWCLTQWGTDSTDVQGDVRRVLRGGAFFYNQYYARCVARHIDRPFNGDNDCGFRVVCGRPPS